MVKPKKIILICLLSAAIVFGIVVSISYLPRRVQQDFAGIELLMTGENEYEILQTLNICIDGRVYYGMFAFYPRFEGSIEISAYDFTSGAHIGINFMGNFSEGGKMTYPVLERGIMRTESLGLLYTDKNFSSLVIHITEWADLGGGSAQGQSGNRVIVAPATDTEDALEVLRSYNVVFTPLSAKVPLYDDLSEQEKVIWDYYNTVNDRSVHPDGNWERRVELYSPHERERGYGFYTRPENWEKRLGILNVKNANIIYMKQIETGSADQEMYPDNEIQTFVVGINCTVYNDGDFYFNGLNWNIMPLVNIDDTWYVTYVGGAYGWTLEEVIERWGEWEN